MAMGDAALLYYLAQFEAQPVHFNLGAERAVRFYKAYGP